MLRAVRGEGLVGGPEVPGEARLERGANALCDLADPLRDARQRGDVEAVALRAGPGLQLVREDDPRERLLGCRPLDPAMLQKSVSPAAARWPTQQAP